MGAVAERNPVKCGWIHTDFLAFSEPRASPSYFSYRALSVNRYCIHNKIKIDQSLLKFYGERCITNEVF
jgi:hypothetical protein